MKNQPPPEDPLAALLHDPSPAALRSLASDPRLSEDLALALLARRDLSQAALDDLARNAPVMKSRKVQFAVATHPRCPRHVALRLVRQLYTFELLQVLLPSVPVDIKVAAEEAILARLETLSAGERLTLAKRGSGRIAGALLLDAESRVIEAALRNPYVTEAAIVKALRRHQVPPALVEFVCRDSKWSGRQDVQLALLTCEHTPLARVLAFAQALPTAALRDALEQSRLSPAVKDYLKHQLQVRARRRIRSVPPEAAEE